MACFTAFLADMASDSSWCRDVVRDGKIRFGGDRPLLASDRTDPLDRNMSFEPSDTDRERNRVRFETELEVSLGAGSTSTNGSYELTLAAFVSQFVQCLANPYYLQCAHKPVQTSDGPCC